MRKFNNVSRCALLLFFISAFTNSIFTQNNLRVEFNYQFASKAEVIPCVNEDTVVVAVSTDGLAAATRLNIQATLNLFKGIEFISIVPSVSTPGVTVLNNNPNKPIFSLPNMTPSSGTSTVYIGYIVRANCVLTDTLSAQNEAPVVFDKWDFTYDMGLSNGLRESDNTTSYNDNLQVPKLTMSVSNNAPSNARVNQIYQRTIYVNYSVQRGWLTEFAYNSTQGPGMSLQSMTINGRPVTFLKTPAFNITNDTLITVIIPDSLFKYNTLGSQGPPADGDNLFETDETVTIIEHFKIENCVGSRLSDHQMSWGCDGRFCTTISETDNFNVGQGSVNVGFKNQGSVANVVGGYCKNGQQVVTLSNEGVEVDPGTATMFDISAGVGLGQADALNLADAGYVITSLKVGGLTIPSPSSGFVVLNNNPLFNTDPDGVGGLSDIDNDGFFDDLPVNESLEIIVEYDVDCEATTVGGGEYCTNDFRSPFNARLDFTNVCQERDSFIQPAFFNPSNTGQLIENCPDPDAMTDGTPFQILHRELRTVANFERECGGTEEFIVSVKLPTGITPFIDSTKLLEVTTVGFIESYDTIFYKSHTISNDTAYILFDASTKANLGGELLLKLGFKADCTAQPGESEFPMSLQFHCPPCNCRHTWYCDTLTGPRIHYADSCPPNPLYACPKGLKTTMFDVSRTTFGYTDSTYTTKISIDSANTKVAMGCDSVLMTVKNIVGLTPIFDSIGIQISYDSIDRTLPAVRSNPIFVFGKGVVEIVKGGTKYTCQVDNTKAQYFNTDTSKAIRIDLHDCLVGLGIAPLNAGDSVNFYGMFAVNPDGAYVINFEKVPNFRATGYYIEDSVDYACDNFGENFRVGKAQALFSFPSSSSSPTGCSEANFNYKVVVINNEFRKYWGDEFRQSVGVDSIRLKYDPEFIKAFSTSVEVSIPNHPIYGNGYFQVGQLDSTGNYFARFDTLTKVPPLNVVAGYAFDLRIRALPNCQTYTAGKNGSNSFRVAPEVYYRNRYYAKDIGDGSCSQYVKDSVPADNQKIIYKDPPLLKFETNSNPNQTIINDTVEWTVKLCNTSEKGNAAHTWLSITPVSPSVKAFRVLNVKDITDNLNIKNYSVKYYSADSTKAFVFMDGLTEQPLDQSKTIDDVCNIVTIKALVRECGTTEFDLKTGWLCALPQNTAWNPTDYAPCVDSSLKTTVFIESPFLDANFINQSLDSTELCDTSTLEILLRNADIGNLYNLKTRITLPLEGAVFVPNSFEYAYPSGAAYQPIAGMPDSLGATQRGLAFEFKDFSKFNTYLTQYGIKGFNPASPNDSNQIKIKFKFISNCSFQSGSLVYFAFDGFNACGAVGNNEIGESAPLFIEGAYIDSLKEFSVSSGASNAFVAGGESIIEVQFKNKNNTPSGPRDEISVKLPSGVTYKPGSSVSLIPANWVTGEPAIRNIGSIQVLTWMQPQGLMANEDAVLQFIVRTADTIDCSGSKDMSIATYYVKDVLCKTGELCRTEIITTSGNKEQFYSIPLSRKPVSLFSNLSIDNNKMYVPQNDTVFVLATGAQKYEWYDVDNNQLIHNDSLLRYVLTRDSAHIMVKSGISPSCVDSAMLTLYWMFDTIPPTVTVRDTSIACQDTFPLIHPTVTDDKSFTINVTYRDSLVNNPCGDILFRIWSATDSLGNITTATQRITKVDTVAPVFTTIPGSKIIQYFETLPNDNPTASDACTTANIVLIKIDTSVVNGDTTFVKNWEATDACGNKSTASQTVIKRTPSVIGRNDTIMVGDSLTFCLVNLGLGGAINRVETCTTGSTGNAEYSINASNCLKIKGLQKGLDSACYNICTDAGVCVTLKLTTLVRHPNTKDSVKTSIQVGERDTICFNTSKFIGNKFTLTNICEDTVTTATFEVYNQTCIIVKGNHEGEKKGCFVLCDTTGKCDTMILTVKVTPSVFERKDSIFVGDSVLYCIKDLTILNGKINSIVSECPESTGKATSYSLDAQNCIVIKGIAKGIDTTCLRVCTDSGQCFRIKLITTVFDKKDTLEFIRHDSLYVGDSVCIKIGNSVLKGNIINVQNECSSTSNRAAKYAFDVSNCLSIKGIKVGIDTACLIVCTDSNICIKIKAVTSVLSKNNNNNVDTIRLVYEVGEVDTVCIPKSIKLGTGISMTNICPDTTNKTVSYKVIKDTCLVITARTKGNIKTCWKICDTDKKCDTVVVDITVISSDSIRLPIANYDTARTLLNQTVVISPLLNDSINGILDTLRVMTIPFNGTAVANKDSLGRWTISYKPDRGFCNTEKEDQFVYEICNKQGCDTAIIYVRVLCDKLKIYNAFSPNGDNKNDVFYIDGLGNFPNTHVRVYNRWGNLVFDDKDYKNTWNGMWNGLKLPDGTYFYHITLENGEKYVGYLQIHH